MPRSLIAAIALATAAASGAAGAQALTVVARTPRNPPAPAREDDAPPELRRLDPGDAEMPWVGGGRPGVATRINDALFLQLIETLAPRAPGDTYTPLPPPHEGLGYFFCEMHFGVDRNDGRVLSIRMALDYRGSGHCTNDSRVFHFDATTGRQLDVADLVTPEGRTVLDQRHRQDGVVAYRRALATLPPDPEDEDADADPDAPPAPPPAPRLPVDPGFPGDDEQRQFFKSCLARWEATEPNPTLEIELPAAGGLSLPSRGCAGNRHEMMMDDPPGPLVIPDAELEPLLTPYGRRLLLGKGTAPAPSDRFGETLHGHVGTAAVTLHLSSPRGERREVDAVYAYDRIGSAITLSGSAHGDALDLAEDGDKGLTLRQVGGALVGTWHGGKGKTLPVRLE